MSFARLLLAVAALALGARAAPDDGFQRALPGRPLVLPADHASHPETRTEWWYFTGPIRTEDGREFGVQATWFRRALVAEVGQERSPLAARDIIIYHAGVVGVQGDERRRFAEQAMRLGGGWARASTATTDVALLEHQLVDPTGLGETWQLSFGAEDAWLELTADLTADEPLLHGREPGLSIKGHEAGQASWYYSLPRLPVRGTLRLGDGEPVAAEGELWFDHEFGSSQLGAQQVGWDWFSVALDDGSELMLYRMRLADGTGDTTSSGTLRRADGTRRHLRYEDFRMEAPSTWTSPETGIAYPTDWVLSVPDEDLELRVTPRRPDQEFGGDGVTGIVYWEGLCRFEGRSGETAVSGDGYVELVGYGEAITSRFATP